jgi:hypothetical protein
MDIPDKQVLYLSAAVISAVIVTGVLFTYGSLDKSSSGEETVEVETDMTDKDIRFYASQEKVAYVSSYSNEPYGKDKNYKNMTLDRYTALNTYHAAEEKVEETVKDSFGEKSTDKLRFDTERHGDSNFTLEVTYDRHYEHSFSYEELKEEVPDQVKGTINYRDHTNSVTLPVFTEAVGTPNDSNYSVESFNSSYEIRNRTGFAVRFHESYSEVEEDADIMDVDQNYNHLRARLDTYAEHPEEEKYSQSTISMTQEGTLKALNNSDYVKYEGTYYNVTFEMPEKPSQDAMSFNAELIDSSITPQNPAKMQLELEINTEENVTISGGPGYPFQVLYAVSGEKRVCMSSKKYEETEHVSDTICVDGGLVNAIGLMKEQKSGDVLSDNYTIKHQSVREPGDYIVLSG